MQIFLQRSAPPALPRLALYNNNGIVVFCKNINLFGTAGTVDSIEFYRKAVAV